MFTSSNVNVFDRFGEITEEIERLAVDGLDAAAREAAAVAQANSTRIDLKLEIVPAHGDVEGYSAGIKSRATSSVKGSTTPIATFFDKGTLGNRRGKLEQPRKASWTRAGQTVHRGDVDGKGIEAERFFLKARIAGRKRLLERLERGPGV